MPSSSENGMSRNDYFSTGGLSTAACNNDLDVETRKKENEVEISRLKFMLHQKELELSELKQQIEKEKLALSVLQTEAETEISNAQKLISDKDAELHAAEESLSGLEEVQIQYWDDGESVEVAGSFNGCIKGLKWTQSQHQVSWIRYQGKSDFGEQYCGFILGYMRSSSL